MNNKVAIAVSAVFAVLTAAFFLREGPVDVPSQTEAPPQLASVPEGVATSVNDNNPAPKRPIKTQNLPDIPVAAPVSMEVQLWQADQNNPDASRDGHPAKRLQSDPDLVAQLQVGQKLHLEVPQRNTTFEAELISTHNPTARTQVWQGKILGGHPQDNVVVTRGQIETHVTIATHEGTYSAIVDNATGETVMVDEGDITVNQIPYEDGIAIDPVEQLPPPANP